MNCLTNSQKQYINTFTNMNSRIYSQDTYINMLKNLELEYHPNYYKKIILVEKIVPNQKYILSRILDKFYI